MKKLIMLLTLIFTMSFTSFGAESIEFAGRDQFDKVHTISEYKGKHVVLLYWATWCGACKYEIKDIQELYEKYGENKEDIVFLGMNAEKRDTVKEYLNENGYTFPTLIEKNTMQLFPISAFPTLIVLNEKGEYVTHAVGVLDKTRFEIFIKDQLLKK